MNQNGRYPDSKNPNSIQDGLEFQDFVMETLAKEHGIYIQNYSSKKYQLNKGENIQRFEIKLDMRCTETRRLSIEIAERTALDRPWVNSGIYANKSFFYVHGNFECFWIFITSFLQQLEKVKQEEEYKYQHKEETTIKAFYLPIEDANKYGIVVEPKMSGVRNGMG